MATTRSKFSERQAGHNVAVDVLALSPQARIQCIHIPFTTALSLTSTATKVLNIPLMADTKVLGASISYTTIPTMAAGTATFSMDHIAVDGTTTTVITTAQTLLSKTSNVPFALVMSATNPTTMLAGGQLRFTTSASSAITIAEAGGGISVSIERVEAAIISDTNATI